jgi:hypothetical protein
MARYMGSTQSSHWLMAPAEVDACRRAALEKHQNPEQSLFLEDEEIVRRHHERRLLRFTTRIGFPDKVAATAISYFKRFYLYRSVLDYNPSVISLSALYASFKVEEVLMSADDLVSRADTILNGITTSIDESPLPDTEVLSVDGTACQVTADALLTSELSFLQSLKFHLICYHPYRCLRIVRKQLADDKRLPALVESGSRRADCEGEPASHLSTLMELSSRIVTRRTMLSDVQFTHSPAAIAIASVISAAHELCRSDPTCLEVLAPEVIQARLLSDLDKNAAGVIVRLVAEVGLMVEGGSNETMVRELETRRRILRDPLNDPMSSEFRRADEQKQTELHEKRRKKALDYKEKMQQETAALMGFSENGTEVDDVIGQK